ISKTVSTDDTADNYEDAKTRSVDVTRGHLKPHAGAQLSVNAGIEKSNFFKSVGIAAIRKTAVVRFRVNVEADRTLAKLGQIQDLMNRFLKLYLGSKTIR